MTLNGIAVGLLGLAGAAYAQTTTTEASCPESDNKLFVTGVLFVTGATVGLISSTIGLVNTVLASYHGKKAEHDLEKAQDHYPLSRRAVQATSGDPV